MTRLNLLTAAALLGGLLLAPSGAAGEPRAVGQANRPFELTLPGKSTLLVPTGSRITVQREGKPRTVEITSPAGQQLLRVDSKLFGRAVRRDAPWYVSWEKTKGQEPAAGPAFAQAAARKGGRAYLSRHRVLDRKVLMISAEHYSERAASLFTKTIGGKIKDGRSWLFLVEKYDAETPETAAARKLAAAHSIPIANPIVNPMELEVLKRYSGVEGGKKVSLDFLIGKSVMTLFGATGVTSLPYYAGLFGQPVEGIIRCVQAVNATVRVPLPPEGLAARFKRGTLLVFSGKDLAR